MVFIRIDQSDQVSSSEFLYSLVSFGKSFLPVGVESGWKTGSQSLSVSYRDCCWSGISVFRLEEVVYLCSSGDSEVQPTGGDSW